MSTKSKQGFFFDLDGTLTNNIQFMLAMYSNFMKELGITHTREEFNKYNGSPLVVFLKDIKSRADLKLSVEQLQERYFEIIEENHNEMKARSGVIETFNELTLKKIPFAIITSSPKHIAKKWICSNIPRELIPPCVTADDVKAGKPSPEPFLLGMRLLGVTEGYAVEDSENGVNSAFNAGLKVIQIGEIEEKKLENSWKKTCTFQEILEVVREF